MRDTSRLLAWSTRPRKRLVMLLRMVTIAALAGGATCGGMSANGPAGQPELEFEILGAMQTTERDSVTVSSTSPGEAVLTGVITTPSPCYEVTAELSQSADGMVLTLSATALPRICAQVLAAFRYRARLFDLAAGSYPMRVIHAYPGTGWGGRHYDLRVDVPG